MKLCHDKEWDGRSDDGSCIPMCNHCRFYTCASLEICFHPKHTKAAVKGERRDPLELCDDFECSMRKKVEYLEVIEALYAQFTQLQFERSNKCTGCGGKIQFVKACQDCNAPDADCFDTHTAGTCAKCLGCEETAEETSE